MKNEVVEFLSRCIECQQVKAEHQHPASLLHPLPIPNWKWKVMSLDFVTSLPEKQKQNDSIMVVIDMSSKATHFIPVKTTHIANNIVGIFMNEIFRLHGIPKVIISDRDPKFRCNFWKTLFEGIDTKINFSTAYDMQTDGKIERVNQVL